MFESVRTLRLRSLESAAGSGHPSAGRQGAPRRPRGRSAECRPGSLRRRPGSGAGRRRWALWAALGGAALVVAIVVVVIASGGGGDNGSTTPQSDREDMVPIKLSPVAGSESGGDDLAGPRGRSAGRGPRHRRPHAEPPRPELRPLVRRYRRAESPHRLPGRRPGRQADRQDADPDRGRRAAAELHRPPFSP